VAYWLSNDIKKLLTLDGLEDQYALLWLNGARYRAKIAIDH